MAEKAAAHSMRPSFAAMEDAVADPAGAEPSGHSAESIHEAGGDCRIAPG
jgi:hypothetical protein